MSKHRPLSVAQRVAVAAALACVAVAVPLANGTFRDLEAQAASYATEWVTGTPTLFWEGHQVFIWGVGTPEARGFLITLECSAAFIVGMLLLIAAVACIGRRLRTSRVLYATMLAITVVVTVNLARMAMIAWATQRWGPQTGFWWSHVVAGSVFTLAGGVLGLLVLLKVGFSQRLDPEEAVIG